MINLDLSDLPDVCISCNLDNPDSKDVYIFATFQDRSHATEFHYTVCKKTLACVAGGVVYLRPFIGTTRLETSELLATALESSGLKVLREVSFNGDTYTVVEFSCEEVLKLRILDFGK